MTIRRPGLFGRLGDLVDKGAVGAQQVRQPLGIVQVEDPMDARLAEVGIEQDRAPTGLREHDGDIRRSGGLALALDRAGHEQRPDRGRRRSRTR